MKIVIVSGMSGAGKTRAANILEDNGFYCVDNMPVELLAKFCEFCVAGGSRYERVALVTDIRSGDGLDTLFEAMESIEGMDVEYKVVFLESATDVIIRRYKETRRPHPLAAEGESLAATVERERSRLRFVRERADLVIDTTEINGVRMRDELSVLFGGDGAVMTIHIVSFGFKYGLPQEADLVFDVRFLPNPFYIEEYREQTGLDTPVRDYVFGFEQTGEFMRKLTEMMEFLIPAYQNEGKSSLSVAIGCTGGRHRSTAIAGELYNLLCGAGRVTLTHRDIEKG